MQCKYAIHIVYFSWAQILNVCIDLGSMCARVFILAWWHISYTRFRFASTVESTHIRHVFMY